MVNYADPSTYASLWGTDEGSWNGSVLFNDNSIQFVYDREFEGTQYGNHKNTLPDNLFIGLNDQNFRVNDGDENNNCDLAPGNGWLNTLPG